MPGVALTAGRAAETQLNAQTANHDDFDNDQNDPVGIVYGTTAAVFYESPYTGNINDIDIHGSFLGASTGLPSGAEIGTPGVGFRTTIDLNPQVALLSNGGDANLAADRSLLVWTAKDPVTLATTLQGQLVDSSGQALTGSPFTVVAAGNPSHADVAGFTDAKSVVVFQNTANQVLFELIGTDGHTPASTPKVIGTGAAPVVTTLANGNFVAAWVGTDVNGTGIHAQIFDQTGAAVGGELGGAGGELNHITQGNQDQVAIATLSDGNFAVAWRDDSTRAGADGQIADTSGTAIKTRVFSANGQPVTGELTINTATTGDQSQPSITAGPNGGFVVGWTDASQQADANGAVDAQGTAIKAQAFDAGGAKIGGELLVNTLTAGDQDSVNLTTGPDGRIFAVFRDGSHQVLPGSAQTPDTSGTGIQSASLTVDTGTAAGVDKTPPTVTFDTTAAFTNARTAVLTGTYADDLGTGQTITVNVFESGTLLGTAQAQNGIWTLTHQFTPGDHGFFTASATDQAGNTSQQVSANYGLTTGTASGTRKAEVDSYTPAGDYTGYTKYNNNGSVYEKLDASVVPGGNYKNSYTGGTAVRALGLSSYFDILSRRTGDLISTTQNVLGGGGQDLTARDGNDTFVFKRGFGEDSVANFIAQGFNHDVISLPRGVFSSLSDALQNTTQHGADAVITAPTGDAITLKNVAVASLQTDNFKFHT